jgi:C4-dicarboxylate-specific signal transduction histidine kinase
MITKNFKSKIPLWAELSLISIIPLLAITASILYFGNSQKSKSESFITTQQNVFKCMQTLESLRKEIRNTHNSIELIDTLKIFENYKNQLYESSSLFLKVDKNLLSTILRSAQKIESNLGLFKKYNLLKKNFEIENETLNSEISNSLNNLQNLSLTNQYIGNSLIKNNLINFLIITTIIIFMTTILIGWRIRSIIQSIHKINHLFEVAGEEFIDLEKMESNSDVEELNTIFNSLVKSSNETYNRRQELQLKSRLATIGETAAHISHEIVSPLTVIKMNSYKLTKQNDQDIIKIGTVNIRMIDRISKIIAATKKGAYLNEEETIELIQFKDFVEEVKLLTSIKLKDKSIDFIIEGELQFEFKAKEGQLLQVFINLINNSSDAIEELSEKWIKIKIQNMESEIKFAIEDSGHGIPEHVLEKLFGSFFTTKKFGKGNGIGLNLSRKIIEGHSGKLFYNKESKNTEFIITLPRV